MVRKCALLRVFLHMVPDWDLAARENPGEAVPVQSMFLTCNRTGQAVCHEAVRWNMSPVYNGTGAKPVFVLEYRTSWKLEPSANWNEKETVHARRIQ